MANKSTVFFPHAESSQQVDSAQAEQNAKVALQEVGNTAGRVLARAPNHPCRGEFDKVTKGLNKIIEAIEALSESSVEVNVAEATAGKAVSAT